MPVMGLDYLILPAGFRTLIEARRQLSVKADFMTPPIARQEKSHQLEKDECG